MYVADTWVMSPLVPKRKPNKKKLFSFQVTPKHFMVPLPELSIILHSDSNLFSLTLTDFLPLFRATDRQRDRQTATNMGGGKDRGGWVSQPIWVQYI